MSGCKRRVVIGPTDGSLRISRACAGALPPSKRSTATDLYRSFARGTLHVGMPNGNYHPIVERIFLAIRRLVRWSKSNPVSPRFQPKNRGAIAYRPTLRMPLACVNDVKLRSEDGHNRDAGSDIVRERMHGPNHTQHHDRSSYAFMAFCQSIITLVARRGLIDGWGPAARIKETAPRHLRLAARKCRYGVSRTARALDPRG